MYDEQSGIRAARAFWFLEYFGHPRCACSTAASGVDVGGLEVTRDAAPPPKSDWTGTREERTLATWRDVRHAVGTPDTVILDTRTDGEYRGTTVRAKRGGAVPGAVHIEWTRNLTAAGDFKPAADLKPMYEDAGVTPDAR